MKALDVAIQSIALRMVDPTERQRYIGLLESMANDCASAVELWRQVITQATTPSVEVAVLMNWTGPAIAKKLFDVHLGFRAKMLAVTDQRGNLEDPVIPSAYHVLKPGETGTSYAQTAIEQARQAMLALRAHVETIRSTVPKKVAAPVVAVKKNSKAAAPKNVTTKKSLIKKAVVKPVAKKRPAAKKPVAKKAAAKKPAPKKVVKKKTRKK